MPVLTSLSSRMGFSLNPMMSSPFISNIPKGEFIGETTIVAIGFCFRWNSANFSRFRLVSSSPFMAKKSSSVTCLSMASRNPSPVSPSTVCLLKSISRSIGFSLTYFLTTSSRYATPKTTCLKPYCLSQFKVQYNKGLPCNNIMHLGMSSVKGRSLNPAPPTNIIAVLRFAFIFLLQCNLLFGGISQLQKIQVLKNIDGEIMKVAMVYTPLIGRGGGES